MATTAQRIVELEQELKRLNSKLKDEVEAEQAAKIDKEQKQVADLLHSLLCKWNHTDGCGWYYHTSPSDYLRTNGDKNSYYVMAGKVLANRDADTVITVLQLILDNR